MASERERPLHRKAREYLLKRIAAMRPGENRLEPEEQLARTLGVSRATVREALADLVREGLITPWQGRGNFGHPHVLGLEMRFDVSTDFVHLLSGRRGGQEADVRQSSIELAHPSERMQRRLPNVRGLEVFAFDWDYTCGGEVCITCRVQVLREALELIPSARRGEMRLTDYLSRFCAGDIIYTTTWMGAAVDARSASLFGLEENTPLLFWEEVFYDLYDRRICFNEIFFHPRRCDLSMLLSTSEKGKYNRS
jgi:DNA-binding GntR family transcriptional regulator